MRLLVLAMVAACGTPSTSGGTAGARSPAADPECSRVARHIMEIGPVDRWITEGHEDGTLPVGGVSDRAGLEKYFDVGCRENWDLATKRCVLAQPTWERVEDACSKDKVWWYQPT